MASEPGMIGMIEGPGPSASASKKKGLETWELES
jgi:hypothetical protein